MENNQNGDSNQFTHIGEIGRDKLLEKFYQFDGFSHSEVIKGGGDDAAVINLSDTWAGVLSSEQFTEGIDFDLTYTPLHHLGYKLVSMTLSDIYAMNAEPVSLLVNLALPEKISVEMLEQFYQGIHSACHEFGVQLSGGDINSAHQAMSIGMTAFGKTEKERLVYRSGAHKDDAICITGDLGGAMAGLRILMREKRMWQEHQNETIQPDLSEYEYVVRSQLVPQARKDFYDMLKEHQLLPSSMIDVTKGLIHEMHQLTRASNVGAHLYEQAIPIAIETRHVADEMEEDVDKYALYGGEDLELVFTAPKKDVDRLAELFNDFVVIGRITDAVDGLKMQRADGGLVTYEQESGSES
mgnify:CR=1 FL=1